MQVFSKPYFKENTCLKEYDKNENISWYEFYKEDINLKKFKIPKLKEIAKSNKLRVGGTKPILMERIREHFSTVKNIVLIQSIFRMYLVKLTIKLRGPALFDRDICHNETDFYTLEPIKNIDFLNFFSYKDKKNFIYGFDITSLLILLKKPGPITNPYNRDVIEFEIVKNISTISKLNKYIYKKKINYIIDENNYPQREITMERMREIRNNEINNRIDNLFYEIDSLGNYTSSTWFKDLDVDAYLNFLRSLWEIWNHRAQMPTITKRRICPYFNPFTDGLEHMNMRIRENAENLNIVKRAAVTVVENIIYTGINNEFRQIGALHVLSALTLVSSQARGSLPWLYESVNF